MKWSTVILLCVFLNACAANDKPAAPLVSESKTKQVHNNSSERFHIELVEQLNQNAVETLRVHFSYEESVEYMKNQFEVDSISEKDALLLVTMFSDRFIDVAGEQLNTEWAYVGSELANHSLKVAYYRATEGDAFAFYKLTWYYSKLVDIENVLLSSSISSMFVSTVQNVVSKVSDDDNARLKAYFDDVAKMGTDKVAFSYQRLPKSMQTNDLVLSVLMVYHAEAESPEMPVSFKRFIELDKPIHSRFYLYYADQMDYQAALDCIEQLPEVVRNDPRILAELATIYVLAGDAETATRLLHDAILEHPFDSNGYFWLLGISLKTQNFEQSELLLNVLRDRFYVEYSRQDLIDIEEGKEFVNSNFYHRYQAYLKEAA
ncbi:tetratricopeptide repeat protein [Agarivorans sp. MS3-6]